MQNKLKGILVILIGFFFIGTGISMMADAFDRTQNGERAVGEVVDLVERDRTGRTYYAPVIEFRTPNGEPYRFTSANHGLSLPPLGASRQILYDPANPNDAIETNGEFDPFISPSMFILAGLASLGLGVFVALKKQKSR